MALCLSSFVLVSAAAHAKMVDFEITSVQKVAFDGRTFGGVGTYQRIEGIATMEVDPDTAANRDIVDIRAAPRNAAGHVMFSSPVYILTPTRAASANGKLVYDVVNRGRKAGLYLLNDAPLKDDPDTAADAGNGYLMEHGYTIAFSGWQSDIPNEHHLMGLDAPILKNVTGESTEEFIFDSDTNPARASLTYPAATLDPDSARLTIQERASDTPRETNGLAFRYLSPTEIEIARPGAFDAGAIYRLTYQAKEPKVSGLGFLAIRDLISFLRGHDRHTFATPLTAQGYPPITAAYGIGVSQSARVLRDLVYLDQNRDEAGHKVFDGILPYVAGSRKSFVNARFAQPGRFSREHEDHDYPGDQFPFSYADSYDPLTRRTDGIFHRCAADRSCPKVLQTDTDTENFQARISLLTSTTEGKPLALPANVRAYFLVGYPHASLFGAKARPTKTCTFLSNPLHPGIVERAVFADLDQWVSNGILPPPSAYPEVADGTVVPAARAGYQGIPGLAYDGVYNALPLKPAHAPAEWAVPAPGGQSSAHYPVFLAKVDQDGFAVAGIRVPDVAAPVATYMGWNPRKPGYAAGELCGITGSTIPFAQTDDARAVGDRRASLRDRYPTAQAYIAAVGAATQSLVQQRLLLLDDAQAINDKAVKDSHTLLH